MKKQICLLLLLGMVLCSAFGCAGPGQNSTSEMSGTAVIPSETSASETSASETSASETAASLVTEETTEIPVITDPVVASDAELTGIDLSKYEKFDWQPTADSYYDSRKKSGLGGVLLTSGKSAALTVASASVYDEKSLPAGTVFVVEEGWEFLLDTWKDEETVNDMYSRRAAVNAPFWVLGTGFWDSCIYGGINVTLRSGESLDGKFEAASSALRIYVPKSAIAYEKPIKVLAIGNSFSVDAMQYLADIASASSDTPLILGNLYISACTLATHASDMKNNSASYIFYSNKDEGTWTPNTTLTVDQEKCTAKSVLEQGDWDIVTIQQASGDSGIASTYNADLDYIISYIKEYCPDAKIYWHMTWAYQSNSSNAAFAKYGNNQETMYNAIVEAVETKVLTNSGIDGVIPAGTAVQNLRAYLGDKVTRDGYHLSYNEGRLTAALCWYAVITGKDISGVKYKPTSDITDKVFAEVLASVSSAVAAPYETIGGIIQ